MRVTKKRENSCLYELKEGQEIYGEENGIRLAQIVGEYEDIDKSPEHLAKVKKALESVKDFVWIENGEIHLGLYGDSEIVLRENDFESKEKYDLLKEVLL